MITKRQISAVVLGAALAFTPALASSQSTDNSGAKQDMKNAGHETKKATKAYNASKNDTKKAANKTKNTTKGAVEGGKEGAKQPQ
jgi:hypothetical protein